MAANVTGLHGVLSGKPRGRLDVDDEQMGLIRRRLAAIHRARQDVERLEAVSQQTSRRKGLFGRMQESESSYSMVMRKTAQEELEQRRRNERVKEIDKLIAEGQQRLLALASEKDVLQRRPNPLWNYTAMEQKIATNSSVGINASRRFNFPPQDLVEEYLDVLFTSGRLVRMNHTDLWRKGGMEDEDDDDDEWLLNDNDSEKRRRKGNGGGNGNWLLRNGLGEKIGEAAETAVYRSVCQAVMGILARGLSAIHGINIMTHSDIRLFMEQTPDLPPLSAGIIPGSGRSMNYAQEALHDVMRGSRKKKRRRPSRPDEFLQRDAVVETLLSHCQISAPLLQLFPLGWQRAMLGNMITLITCVLSDFFDGLEFQILGHRLSFAFAPITEEDMIRRLGEFDAAQRHRAAPSDFEAAVTATAQDVADSLRFLDRWHQRALGGDVLRTQIANLIARLVLTLLDDVLTGARMDLWTAQAGGPRLVAGLEHRTSTATQRRVRETNFT